MARYASYSGLAEIIRHRFDNPQQTLEELFGRMVFNILCGNTDDHARNHAALWDGKSLNLTPAYDICPQARTGNEASQAMLISENSNMSQLANCLSVHRQFLLGEKAAIGIINNQIETININWGDICEEAKLTEVDRNFFWQRQFLNPFVFEGAPAAIQHGDISDR